MLATTMMHLLYIFNLSLSSGIVPEIGETAQGLSPMTRGVIGTML